MTKEEIYLEKKRKNLIYLIDTYNKTIPFEFDKENLNIESTLCNSNRCSNCGNSCCCLASPCIFSPNDFLDIKDLDYMRNLLDTGLICISKLGNNNLLILRPRGVIDKDYIISGISLTYGEYNPCILNGTFIKSYEHLEAFKDGCLLPVEYRPSDGLLYYATNNDFDDCIKLFPMSAVKKEYLDYQVVLQQLSSEYMYKKMPLKKYLNGKEIEENVKKFTKRLVGYNG